MSKPVEIEDCSDHFQDAVCDGGSLVNDCALCGRVHFATHATEGFYDEGELEKLREKQKTDPDKYRAVDASSVSHGTIAGMDAVYGCLCGWKKVRRYEDAFWSHREIIKRYFEKRTAEALNVAQGERAKFGDLKT